MGADTHHHQPVAVLVERAVLVSRIGIGGQVLVLGLGVDEIGELHGAAFLDLLVGAATDEDRLAAPFYGKLGANLDAGDIDEDRRQRLDIGRGVHLVHKSPAGGAGRDGAGPGGRVVEEIPPGACVIICLGHEHHSLLLTGVRPCEPWRRVPATFTGGY